MTPEYVIPETARQEWSALTRALAATPSTPCQKADPEVWFPETRAQRERAAWECFRCPVVRECAAYGKAAGEPSGVWGGRDRGRRVGSLSTLVEGDAS